MLKKRAWIIPVNTAILFGILCFWSIQQHDTLWAVIDVILSMVNVFFAYRWIKMRRPSKS
jgi:hypothetical protein